ncbi:MAG: ATP-binding protein, partial [Solirubrobacteraceae bacterium]
WGIEETLVDEAALVLSELANNAVIHADSPFSISIDAHEAALRIAVTDSCRCVEGSTLVPRFGHGLGVIQALSSAWGVEEREGGKVVWAELTGA